MMGKRGIYLVYAHFLFSSPDPKGQVSYCHHLASVVVRPSYIVNFFKNLLL